MVSVVHVIVGLGNGGAEKTLSKVCSLDTNNSHVVISLRDSGFYGPVMRSSKNHVHCMGMRWWNVPLVLRSMRRLRCLREAEVITAWMPHAILLAPLYFPSRSKAKLVLNLRASSYGGHVGDLLRKSILNLWAVAFGRRVVGLILPGEASSRGYRKFRLGREKIKILNNGFEVANLPSSREYPPRENSETVNASQPVEPVCLGMFARWHPQKNHDGLLKVLSELSESGLSFRLILAGQGINWANGKLTAKLRKYSLTSKVALLGPLDSLDRVTGLIDLHVLPSAFGEAFPNVVAETMLGGVPNIVTDIGDSAQVVGDTGWIVEPNNSLALREALTEATRPNTNWAILGSAARERILNNFPLTKMVKAYSDYYQGLLSGISDRPTTSFTTRENRSRR